MLMRGNGRIRGFIFGMGLAALSTMHQFTLLHSPPRIPPSQATAHQPEVYIDTYVTGYNTVPAQTDDTPCIAASGVNICGRHDTIACPPLLKLGSVVGIRGKKYVCEDRIARKYKERFDINCDKDIRCPYKVAGRVLVKVELE
jgi:hypothetical protein